jgi:hypothetical protein
MPGKQPNILIMCPPKEKAGLSAAGIAGEATINENSAEC